MNHTISKPIEILLVEDNPDDVDLTREALKEAGTHINLHTTPDGVECLAFLNRDGIYADAPRPDLILLDLNMPRKDGREVLAEIKTNKSEHLRRIPVVVLTTSESEEDILSAYDLHANCYITKPVDFNLFVQMVQSLEAFWFTFVKLPGA